MLVIKEQQLYGSKIFKIPNYHKLCVLDQTDPLKNCVVVFIDGDTTF